MFDRQRKVKVWNGDRCQCSAAIKSSSTKRGVRVLESADVNSLHLKNASDSMFLSVQGILSLPLFPFERQMVRVISLLNKALSTILRFSPSLTTLISDKLLH